MTQIRGTSLITISRMTFPVQLPTSKHAELWESLPQARLSTFLTVAPHGTADEALAIYEWDRKLSMAFMSDIAIVEVALREAIHRAATVEWGTHWYRAIPLDSRSEKTLNRAWNYLPRHVRDNPNAADLPGRLVANCMFGFWTNLLDTGGYRGEGPRRERVRYDDNWSALRKAFPNGRTEAAHQRQLNPSQADEINFSRAWVYGICKRINDTRNRVAHHEPILNGFPVHGQDVRMSTLEAFEEIQKLARMLSLDLAHWLETNSDVPETLNQRPF